MKRRADVATGEVAKLTVASAVEKFGRIVEGRARWGDLDGRDTETQYAFLVQTIAALTGNEHLSTLGQIELANQLVREAKP